MTAAVFYTRAILTSSNGRQPRLDHFPVVRTTLSWAMEIFPVVLLVGLQVKHFVADYLLQPGWMVGDKHSFTRPGGYIHVGIHLAGSSIVLLLYGIGGSLLAALLIGEAIAHYGVDLAKARWSRGRPADIKSRAFWAAHGVDQMMHQLTYAGMILAVAFSMRDG